MNVRHPSLSNIHFLWKNIFKDKIDLRFCYFCILLFLAFLFLCDDLYFFKFHVFSEHTSRAFFIQFLLNDSWNNTF